MLLSLHYLLFILFIEHFIVVRGKKSVRDTESNGTKVVAPYHVALMFRAFNMHSFLGEGVIVTDKAVLTRAECIAPLVKKPTENEEYYILAGTELENQVLRTIKFFCYNSKGAGLHEPTSVALAFTEYLFDINKNVGTISLSNQVPAIGTQCYACHLKTDINLKIEGTNKTSVKIVKCDLEDSEIICTEPVRVNIVSNPLICGGSLVGLATNTEPSKEKTQRYVKVIKDVDWVQSNMDNPDKFVDSRCSNTVLYTDTKFGFLIAALIILSVLSLCCLGCCCVICIVAALSGGGYPPM